MTTRPQPAPTGAAVGAPSAEDGPLSRTPQTTQRTEWVVQYRYPDDTDWFDTVDSPLQTLAAACGYRAWYHREVGLPSRLIERRIRVTVLDD